MTGGSGSGPAAVLPVCAGPPTRALFYHGVLPVVPAGTRTAAASTATHRKVGPAAASKYQ